VSTLTRSELAAYALCAVVVALIGARALRSAPSSAPATVPLAPARTQPPPGPAAPAAAGRPVVHVVGAVRSPGLYTLRAGARVADAVRRAGGPTGEARLEGLNLAARVLDAQQVVVPERGALVAAPGAGAAPAAPGAPDAPIDLNTATAEQLDELDGIGPATAAKILEAREAQGGFRSVDDLAQVPGIGPKRLAALRERVRV